jgi:hypothetical protein
MSTNNSSNNQYDNNSDGFDLSGGTTKRKLTVTGANITLTGSGTNVYTMPASTDTLVGRATTDALTNKDMSSTTNLMPGSTIGYASISTTFSTASTTFVDVTGLTTGAITIPTGGRRIDIDITASSIIINAAAAAWAVALLEDGAVIQQWYRNETSNSYNLPINFHFSKVPSSGSHTYKVQVAASGGTVSVIAGTTSSSVFTPGPASIQVKLA